MCDRRATKCFVERHIPSNYDTDIQQDYFNPWSRNANTLGEAYHPSERYASRYFVNLLRPMLETHRISMKYWNHHHIFEDFATQDSQYHVTRDRGCPLSNKNYYERAFSILSEKDSCIHFNFKHYFLILTRIMQYIKTPYVIWISHWGFDLILSMRNYCMPDVRNRNQPEVQYVFEMCFLNLIFTNEFPCLSGKLPMVAPSTLPIKGSYYWGISQKYKILTYTGTRYSILVLCAH